MPRIEPHPEIYTADNGEFGWRVQDGNNQIVATGHETYTRAADAERALRNVASAFNYIRRQLSRSGYEVPHVPE
jgi:uncharacterized protein YegP (UPF0339 family)